MLAVVPNLSISPASEKAQAFTADIASFASDLASSEGKPSRILGVAERFEETINDYGDWQSAEVTRAIQSMAKMLKLVTDSLRDSIAEIDGSEGELDALTQALELAHSAESIDDVRKALDGQCVRVQKLHDVLARQRRRCQARLEAAISTLEDELAVAVRDRFIDGLTGALNRAGFEGKFAEAKLKLHEETWSLAMFDLDGFKSVNDSLGHVAGDAALKAFVQALQEAVPNAAIARFGGDEFVLIAREGMTALTTRLAKFRANLPKKEIRVDCSGDPITMRLATSFGVTGIVHQDTPDISIARADEELYKMKRQFRTGKAA